MKLIVIAICLIGTSLLAQNAKVVELKPSESIEAKATYEQMKAAEKKWEDFQARVQGTYKGFDVGLDFDSDFRFIVPKAAQPSATTWPNSCFTVASATTNLSPNMFSNGTTSVLSITP